MPTDLHDFFSKMLSGPDDGTTRSIERASQLLRIRACGEITLIALLLADENDLKFHCQLPPSEIPWRMDAMKRRLNSLTRGLLETTDASPGSNVQYLHRTVKDFVESPQTSALFDQFPYDPDLALFQSHVLQVKFLATIRRYRQDMGVYFYAGEAFNRVSFTQARSRHAVYVLFDLLNGSVESHRRSARDTLGFREPPKALLNAPILLPWALKDQVLDHWSDYAVQKMLIQIGNHRTLDSLDAMLQWVGDDGARGLVRILDERYGGTFVVDNGAVKRDIAKAMTERLRRRGLSRASGNYWTQTCAPFWQMLDGSKGVSLYLIARAFWVVLACACFITKFIRSLVRTTMRILRFPLRPRHTFQLDLEMEMEMGLYPDQLGSDEWPCGVTHTQVAFD